MKKLPNDVRIDETSKQYAREKIAALKAISKANLVYAKNEVLECIIRLSYKEGFVDGLRFAR